MNSFPRQCWCAIDNTERTMGLQLYKGRTLSALQAFDGDRLQRKTNREYETKGQNICAYCNICGNKEAQEILQNIKEINKQTGDNKAMLLGVMVVVMKLFKEDEKVLFPLAEVIIEFKYIIRVCSSPIAAAACYTTALEIELIRLSETCSKLLVDKCF